MQNTLNIHKFMTVATHLAFAASKIINDVKLSSNLNIHLKEKEGVANDPVTQADFKSQTLIIKGLKKYWPTINIVGEQETQFQGLIQYDESILDQSIFPEDAFIKGKNGQQLPTTLDLSKIIVWVDPLDATLSYTQGYLDQVTTLIGVSYEGKSCLGVIGIPYIKQGNQNPTYSYQPKVFAAHSSNPYCTVVDRQFKITHVHPRNHNKDNIRMAITRSKISEESLSVMQSITKNISRMGGMGKKALQIVENRQDILCYLGRGISTWDVSAPEAVILSINGGISKSDGSSNNYEIADKYLIPQGSIICSDKQLLELALGKIKSLKN